MIALRGQLNYSRFRFSVVQDYMVPVRGTWVAESSLDEEAGECFA